jgi:hypothetical protein
MATWAFDEAKNKPAEVLDRGASEGGAVRAGGADAG